MRVILYENDNGGCSFEYDLPSSLFAQFNDERVTEIERGVDDALARALSIAAGVLPNATYDYDANGRSFGH